MLGLLVLRSLIDLNEVSMTLHTNDWVALIEAAYTFEGGDQEWLDRVFACANPLLDRGMARNAYMFECTPTTFRLGEIANGVSRGVRTLTRVGHAVAPAKWFDLTYRSGVTVGTASEVIYPHIASKLYLQLTRGYSRDLFMTGGHSGTGLGIALATQLKDERRATTVERKRWPQIGAHLGAGLRLRHVARTLSFDAASVEAILDSGGKLHNATEMTAAPWARERLRNAVRCIERARTIAGRNDPDTALDAWEGLVAGRWSMIDRFDTDGKRFIVAVKNDPAYPDPRGLTPRERQVAEFVGLGRTTKDIRYTLGISDAAVANCTARAQLKLGLSSRVELATFFSHGGLRRKLAEVTVGGERLLVGASPFIDDRSVAPLSNAERDVLGHLIKGSTNADIALRRGSSEHTVANQVQSIFRKLGARSRGELAARLQTFTAD